jgi:hypothetical protein
MYLKVFKKRTNQTQEIIKIKAEINEIETKRIQRINEIKSWFSEKIRLTSQPN